MGEGVMCPKVNIQKNQKKINKKEKLENQKVYTPVIT